MTLLRFGTRPSRIARLSAFARQAPSLRTMANSSAPSEKFKLVFFAPAEQTEVYEKIKDAIFATGAGSYPGPGGYTHCCFQTPGIGQFKPGSSAKPNIGEPNKFEQVGELRCEVLCLSREITKQAVEALKRTHPYEEVPYEVYKVEDF